MSSSGDDAKRESAKAKVLEVLDMYVPLFSTASRAIFQTYHLSIEKISGSHQTDFLQFETLHAQDRLQSQYRTGIGHF